MLPSAFEDLPERQEPCRSLLQKLLDLPFDAIVRGLMLEFGLSRTDATITAFDAMQREAAA